MKKSSFILILIILVLVAIVGIVLYTKYYPFTINEQGETTSCQSCICIGVLAIAESYPEQYFCTGWEFCKDTELSECP